MAAFSSAHTISSNAAPLLPHSCSARAVLSTVRSAHFIKITCTPALLGVRAQHSEPQPRQHNAPNPTYTSMRADPPRFWDSHKGLFHLNVDKEADFLSAELRLLANAASDRAEMHNILAHQRDNWNKLFQFTLTAACMTSCVLSGLDGQAHSPSLSVPALLLNSGSAVMMATINLFQPSQLAEEQRTAARLFHKLSSHIHYGLHTASHLCQDAPSLLRDCKRRLQALDKAFPMPLAPGGLDKFPAKVVPPVLIEPNDTPHDPFPSTNVSRDVINGWDEHLTWELQQVAALLRRSDIPKYAGWAQNLVIVNRSLAFTAPILTASAAVLNATALAMTPTASASTLGMWAASCSVMAAFAGSFLHDMQLGMVFELYRNSAGYYADVESDIKETLREPVEKRENGALFRQRIAYQLGRWPDCSSTRATSSAILPSMVPKDAEEAGTLF